MSNTKQIWLKPKPEHIDDNFEDFLLYLKTNTNKDSELYVESIRLLKERVDMLIVQRFDTPIYRHSSDKQLEKFNVRLCATWLMSIRNESYSKRKTVFIILLNNLIQLCLVDKKNAGMLQTSLPKSVGKLFEMVYSMVTHKLPDELTISWSDILQKSQAGMYDDWSFGPIIESLIKMEFNEFENSLFEGKGSFFVENGNIDIKPEYRLQNSKFEKNTIIPSWSINIFSEREYKIKKSRINDIEAIDNCIANVIRTQSICKPIDRDRILKHYSDGDSVVVEIVKIDKIRKKITVKSIDSEYYEESGDLIFDAIQLFDDKHYPIDMWLDALNEGDCVEATFNGKIKCFSITNLFVEYIHRCVKENSKFHCKFYREVNPETGYYEFIDEKGLIIFVRLTPEQIDRIEETDDLEDVNTIIRFHKFKEDTPYLKGCVQGSFEEIDFNGLDFKTKDACQGLVENFIDSVEDNITDKSEEEYIELDKFFMKELCNALNVIQRRESNPQERFRMLGVLRVLSVLAEFDKEFEYVSYLSNYIKTLIQFSQANEHENKCIENIEIPYDLKDDVDITSGSEILKILSYFSMDYISTINEEFAKFIESDDEFIRKTASLVQSYNRLKDMLDDRTLKGIKRQILETLSIVVAGDSDLDLLNKHGVNFGLEDDTKEFKTSFFNQSNTSSDSSQEYTIYKAVCALMNNVGGVIYLGVKEDSEHRGIPIGIDDDLKELTKRYPQMTPTHDDYIRHINQRGEYWLGETNWHYVSVKSAVEYNIVEIKVDPYPYDVVFLRDKKAYLRKNNNTDRIKEEESTFEDIRRRRQEALRKIDDKIIHLQDAISKGVKARLIRYQSSHSEITEHSRIVEPFKMIGHEYVICYEIKSSQVKMFRISRIEKVDILDEKSTNKDKHIEPDIDVFNMTDSTGGKSEKIKIKLKLRLRAKNALCEQYPKSEQCLKSIDKDSWLFETEINSLKPLISFYLSYAESIEIIEAPGLIDEIKAYIARVIPLASVQH